MYTTQLICFNMARNSYSEFSLGMMYDEKYRLKVNINPFFTSVPFLYPLKTSENLWFSDVFRGCKKGTYWRNGLINFQPLFHSYTLCCTNMTFNYPAGKYVLNQQNAARSVTQQEIEYSPANIYLLKVNNRNTRKRCKICSKLTIKTPQWCQLTSFWRPHCHL